MCSKIKIIECFQNLKPSCIQRHSLKKTEKILQRVRKDAVSYILDKSHLEKDERRERGHEVGWVGGGEHLGEVEGGENLTKIYCMKKRFKQFF